MNKTALKVSLLVTTYNSPAALELVLLSIINQSVKPDEVIIADDGSKTETTELIQKFQQNFPTPLHHCWHEDNGFRLAHIRNKAIAQAKSEYIVMIDGDMVLHRHFIRDHKRIAKTNHFIQGRRVILTEKETTEALKEKRITFSIFSSGVKNKINACCCSILSRLLSRPFSKKDHRAVRSCNMALWRDDIILINGFNEDFIGWGREDSEFVVRLLNNNIKRIDLRFGGVAYHLHHAKNSTDNLKNNDHLLEQTIKNKTRRCQKGIDQYLTI